MIEIRHGDCIEMMRAMDDACVDAIVTDPPYELGFMGKGWDATGIANSVEMWREAYRVLKPGGHLLAFSHVRTYHRMTCAIEDAGFEIRDCIRDEREREHFMGWVYGTGFPKAEQWTQAKADKGHAESAAMIEAGFEGWARGGLKPAWEPICVARKPLIGTVAANVLEHGTGALNIDGCRVACATGDAPLKWEKPRDMGFHKGTDQGPCAAVPNTAGRWPANVIHDGSDEVLAAFAQFGESKSQSGGRSGSNANPMSWTEGNPERPRGGHNDSGTSARFFYSAKASKADRAGSKHPTVKPVSLVEWLVRLVTPPGGTVLDPFGGSGTLAAAAHRVGVNAILIEKEAEYYADILRRVEALKAEERPTDLFQLAEAVA